MKKIVLGITSLGLGGAERVLVDLANQLADEYEITILLLYGKGELIGQLREEVKVEIMYPFSYQELSTFQKKVGMPLKVLLQKRRLYNKFLKGKFEEEIAFLEGPITRIFAVKNRNVKKMAWIHNDISLVFGKGIKSQLKKWMDKKIYEKFDTLIFVSKDNRESFDRVYGDIRNDMLQPVRKRVIYNYIEKERVLKKAEEQQEIKWDCKQKNLVTVARLVEQKGLDRWIEVHHNLIRKGYFHKVYVVGEGPAREELEKKIKEEKVEDTFLLLGKKENPYPYMKNCDYFCLLSYFEGYGMVLEEAKILQKPIIITDTAAREAVIGYENACILPNEKVEMEKGLEQVLKQSEIGFKTEKIEEYDNHKILEKVKKVIEEPKMEREVKPKG